MSCNRMESRILPYVDGRLKAGEMKEVEAHLKTCAACQLRVNEFRAVSSFLDELPQIEPSSAFDARVHARVAAEPVKRSWWSVFAPSPRVAFAASMLLLATVWFGSRPNETVAPGITGAEPEQVESDLPVLENFDVLSSFDALSDLPAPVSDESNQQQQQQQPETNTEM
ncbi:MAG: zf-HC2 domain-containing protein [Acidobacteria bacterium]|nr:zf-HC2 domain-containing protein [Acidobacteriota bacterium]